MPWSRKSLVNHARFARGSFPSEKYPPGWGDSTISQMPLAQGGAVGVISTITVGPTGIGSTYQMAEPVGNGWHALEGGVAPGGLATPMVERYA